MPKVRAFGAALASANAYRNDPQGHPPLIS
jgi:hypothetical protein